MPKYRRIPHEIEAVKWDGSDEAFHAAQKLAPSQHHVSRAEHEMCLRVETIHGNVACQLGDYVVQSVDGADVYPVRASMFEQLHELVEE